MFVQVMRGKAGDVEGARRQMDRWAEELRPGAKGFLGSTAGVTSGGEMIAIARFESAELAKANSERVEQGQWWQDMEKTYSSDVIFKDSADVDLLLGGGSNDAGFVQVMTGRAVDKARARALQPEIERAVRTARPEVIGGFVAWHDDGTFTEAVYFKSQSAARSAEQGEQPAALAEIQEAMPVTEYLDLTEPWIV